MILQTNPKKELTLDIETLSYGPYGIGRHNGKAVMIAGTAPGDSVTACIAEDKGRYAVGELIRVISASPVRQIPPCPYVAECGGCPWQHVNYEGQIQAKQKSVEDALRRIGKLDGFELRPIIASPLQYNYRRRIRLQRNDKKRLGFFQAFSHELVEIDSCLIADGKLNRVIERLQQWSSALATHISHLEIVRGDEAGQLVVSGLCTGTFNARDNTSCENLRAHSGSIEGLVLRGPDWRRTWGDTVISIAPEKGVRLTIDGDVFTQINSEGNRQLVGYLHTAGEFNRDDRVLELYSGAGNFTLPLAKRSAAVVAVEAYGAAVASGRRSARLNGIGNIQWICSPAPDALAQLRKSRERFSKIVLDPPRAGAKDIVHELASFGAEQIIYVSCDPATLARDLAVLTKHKYTLRTVQPIDLFPHTFHVETVATLVR